MHNVAMNYLKNNYMIKKGCKTVVSMFDSRQSFFIHNYVAFMISRNKDNKDRNLIIIDFTSKVIDNPSISGTSNVHHHKVNLHQIPQSFTDLIEKYITDKTKKNVVIILGLEIYLNVINDSQAADLYDILNNGGLNSSVRSLQIMLLPDQLLIPDRLKHLQKVINFTLDFRSVDHFDKFTLFAVNYQDNGINIKEQISGSFKDNILALSKYVPENIVIEKKDPDKLIKSTFKLGMSETEKVTKDKLILPYYQEKQIKEMEEKVMRGDEDDEEDEIELGIDDEVDEDEDLDV